MRTEALFDWVERTPPRPLAICFAIGLALSAQSSAADGSSEKLAGNALLLSRRAMLQQPNPHAWPRPPFGSVASASPPRPSAAHAPTAPLVTNCNDDGIGSLRMAALNANPDDVIDLTHLPCSTITLTSGAIHFNDATVNGPGAALLTIDGHNEFQVIHHDGTGFLVLNEMTIANSKYNRSGAIAQGGCIYSAGGIELNAAVVTNCHAHSSGDFGAYGGAIFSTGLTVLISSTVSGNSVATSGGVGAYGGGVFSRYSMLSYYSTIADNSADGGTDGSGIGGGAAVIYSSIIRESTISGNRAQATAGLFTGLAGVLTSIYNSTISGNQSINSTTGSGVFFLSVLPRSPTRPLRKIPKPTI